MQARQEARRLKSQVDEADRKLKDAQRRIERLEGDLKATARSGYAVLGFASSGASVAADVSGGVCFAVAELSGGLKSRRLQHRSRLKSSMTSGIKRCKRSVPRPHTRSRIVTRYVPRFEGWLLVFRQLVMCAGMLLLAAEEAAAAGHRDREATGG